MHTGKASPKTAVLTLLIFILGLFLPLVPFIVTAEAIEQSTRNELVTELIHYIQDKYQSGEDLDAHAAYVLSLAGENPDDSNWQRNGRSLKSDIETLADLLGDGRNLATYVLANQNGDGSFGPYANEYTTAPALQALAVARNDIPVGDAVYAEVEEAITKAVLFLQESYRTHGYAADTFGFDYRCVEALVTAGIDLDTADWRQNGSTLKESVVENAYRVADEAGSVTDAVYLAKHLNALYAVEPTDAAVDTLAERLLALQQGDANVEDGLFGSGSLYAELLVLRVLGQTGNIGDAVRQDDALTFINQFRYEHHNVFGFPAGYGWGGFGGPESDTTAQVLSVFSAFTVDTAEYQDEALAYLSDIQHPDTAGIHHLWDRTFATAETLLALHSLGLDWQQGQWIKDSRTKTVSQCLPALNEWNDAARVERLADILANRQKPADPGRGSFENSVDSDMWAFLALGESGKLSVINTVYARDYLLGKQQADTREEDGSWGETRDDVYCPDFLSTGQALRSLTYFPGYADDQDVTAAIEAGIEWLKSQSHDDGSYYLDDPLVDTAELILTLARLDRDPAGPEWTRTVDGQAVGPVDYLRSHAHDSANVFAATQALHALLVVPMDSFDGTSPGSPGSGETDVVLVSVAVVGKNVELLFRSVYVPLTKDNEWGLTALGALDATGLPYQTSDRWRGFVTCIAGQCNQGMDGWMYKVNGVTPGVSAADKAVRDGDRVIWWYGSPNDPGPGDELWERPAEDPEEQPKEEEDIPNGDLPAILKPSAVAEEALRRLSELLEMPEGAVLGPAAEAVRAVAVLESANPLSWKAWRQLREELSRNPVDLTQEVTAMEGAVLSDADARIGLSIPPEALDRDITITIRELRREGAVPPVPAGYRPVSAFFALEPGGTTFSRPATLALRLAVPPTVRPENLVLTRYDRKQNTWTILPAVYDPARRLLVAGVEHFSTFAVLGRESRTTFADVGADSFGWARDPVEVLAGAGIIRGVGDNRFEPGRPVTRAELICLLARALELEETPGSAFTDVPAGAWYAGAVNAAAGAGLARGYADGGFRPEAPITRQELASMLVRALELDDTGSGALTFTDAEAVAEWAKNSVSAASAAGLVTGYPDGSFRPGSHATRAETAAMVCRALMIDL
ncbi:MAG: S-layer homology domain-containing protein [Candidatus Desulforudis sp.]|nr:S-layer homology domain-containing protein [Desulforudis sp.]